MEQQLKQRLVGAIVLVSLAVIFIPVILEGPDDELAPRFQELPETPQVDYNASIEMPLPAARPADESADADVQDVEPVTAPVASETPQAPVAAVPEPPPPAATPAAPQPAPAAAKTVREPPSGWYAQVGSFSQLDNASSLQDTLGKAGHQAHVQQVATVSGHSYRVLVGPSASREAATRELDKLAAGMKITGLVIELPTPAR
jgi:DedD protein